MTSERWDGELYIGFAFALFHGRAGDTEPHRHYAAQCAYGEVADVEVEWADGAAERARWLYIPSEALHRLRSSSATIRMLYYEPAMANNWPVEDLIRDLTAANWQERDWSTYFRLPDTIDPRVRQALDLLDDEMDPSIGATAMSRSVGLSRNRFMTLFSTEIGVPVRRYILWHRLKLAATAIAGGVNLTAAAHAAGFSDSAHFARTMKAMFGVTATECLQRLSIKLL